MATAKKMVSKISGKAKKVARKAIAAVTPSSSTTSSARSKARKSLSVSRRGSLASKKVSFARAAR